MHISIAGKLGSGKSEICKLMASEHGYEIYSAGALLREVANKLGISVVELNDMLTTNSADKLDIDVDYEIDHAVETVSRARKKDNIIFDSRMAWHFAEKSFKVFVYVDPYIAAQRVIGAGRGKEEVYDSIEEAKYKLLERSDLENMRYMDLYKTDNFNYNNYDLVIDSSYLTPSQLCDTIYKKCCEYEEQSDKYKKSILLSPKSLYPTKSLTSADTVRDVKIFVYKHYNFIIEGHNSVLRAINADQSLVSTQIISSKNLTEIILNCSKKDLEEYETAGGFKYKSYPDCYR